MAGTGLVIF